jgi:hypothetical protein
MNVACLIGGHGPRAGEMYNSGYWFSDCRRCGRALIRTARSEWAPVPAGYRVIWAGGRRSHALEADYSGVLPIVQAREEAAVPALPSPFVSWSRALTRLRVAGAAPTGARTNQAVEEGGDYDYPRLLLLAVLVGAGIRMLLEFAGGR